MIIRSTTAFFILIISSQFPNLVYFGDNDAHASSNEDENKGFKLVAQMSQYIKICDHIVAFI
jgi:hypothetical protein